MDRTENLIKMLGETALPVKASPSPLGLFLKWVGGSAAYLAIVMMISGIRPDIMVKLHEPLFAAEIGLLALVVISSGFSAAILSFPDLYQKKWVIYLPVIPLAAFAYVLYVEWLHQDPNVVQEAHGIECLLCISVFSLFSAVTMLLVLKKRATTHYYLAGAIAMLASSSIGTLAFRFCEQTDSISHLIHWHYLPLLGFSALGVLLGRKFLRW